jgi:hypothetical protein
MDDPTFTNGHLRVLASDGRVVLEQRMNSPREVLDVQRLPAGAYTLQISDEGDLRMMQRFVKH